MADQREEIKQKIDIVDLVSEYVPLKKIGRNLKANCPFHSEKTPSFYVSPERQIWHCFGCQKGGDAYSFLMEIENIEFVEALRILAKKAGVALTEFVPTQTSELKDRLYEINHLAAEFFNYILTSHPLGKEALSYVSGRGVTKDSIAAFKIGYAPKSWDSLLRFLRDKKGYKENEIEQAGLAVRSERGSYYDRFRGRLMFSLRDVRGNVVGFSGRVLDPEAKEAKYINSPETPIYIKGNLLYGLEVTKGAIRKEGTAVVVEGEFDLISSYQAGVANVCAIKGSALTDAQVKLLKRLAGTIILSLDADLAGDAAARRGIEIADREGLNIRVVRLLSGKDPDECVKNDPSLWRRSVLEAVPIYDYYILSGVERYGKDTAEAKKKIGEELLPIWAKITNEIVRDHYVKELSTAIGVDIEAIEREMANVKKAEKLGVREVLSEVSSPTRAREEVLGEYFLSLVLQADDPGFYLREEKILSYGEYLLSPPLKKIFEGLVSFEKEREAKNEVLREGATREADKGASLRPKEVRFEIASFVAAQPSELSAIIDRLYLFDIEELKKDEEAYRKEIAKMAFEVKLFSLKKKLSEIGTEMKKQDEGDSDQTELERLSRRFGEVALELKRAEGR